jgi:hypothetical protein
MSHVGVTLGDQAAGSSISIDAEKSERRNPLPKMVHYIFPVNWQTDPEARTLDTFDCIALSANRSIVRKGVSLV